MLIAIDPNDGRIEARTLSGGREINAFVAKWNGERNIYYAANPTRGKLDKKAEKEDVYAIEYLLSDLDPVDDESPEEAKARYLKQLESFTARPTMLMDSGNGLQALWQLKTPIALEAPIQLDPIKVKGKRKPITSQFSAEDQAKIDDAEARSAALMRRLGAPTGTQNIDRILRLPETINLPSKAKKAKGRVTCYTRLLWFEWSKYSLEDFPRDQEAPQKARDKRNGAAGSHHMKLPGGIADAYELDDTGNGHGFRFMRRQRHKGMDYEQAKAAILADEGRAGEWANRVDERQLERAYERAFLYDKDEDSDSGSELKHRLLQTSAEFVANFVPPDYLIDGWLQRRFVYSFTAPTGSGGNRAAHRRARGARLAAGGP
jgi:hypothetical protein